MSLHTLRTMQHNISSLASMEEQNSHIVLFPFLANGHINAFVSLASVLCHHHSNLTITFVSTPHNIQFIRSWVSFSSSIRFHSLPLNPESFGLPPNAESMADIQKSQYPSFLFATGSLQPAFDTFVSCIASDAASRGIRVAIVSDIFLGWTVEVARKYRVFHSVFLTMSCYGSAIYFSIWSNLPHTKTTSDWFSLPEYPDIRVHRSQLSKSLLETDGTSPGSIYLRRQLSLCFETDSMLVNTVEMLEKKWIDMFAKYLKIPIFPIGPLLGGLSVTSPSTEAKIIEWLELHPIASVLYISFGSQHSTDKIQRSELALALETSRRPFIWVIRAPSGFDAKDESMDELLPDGFEKRMKEENRGFFVHEWAPQMQFSVTNPLVHF